MLDPTDYARCRDYIDFGDMFFIRNEDPREVNNAINDPKYAEVIEELRTCYEAFIIQNTSLSKNGNEWHKLGA